MTAEIIHLPGSRAPAQPVAHYLRIGESGHRQLADLFAAGRFPAQRVVADASRFEYQSELIKSLQAAAVEVVLDTKAAELSALSKYSGYASNAPWALAGGDGPLGPEHFNPTHRTDVLGQIARFAVEKGLDAVLAPCHYLQEASRDHWLRVDVRACEALRIALDREGGQHIAVDYSLIVPHTLLRDEAVRGALTSSLSSLPFDNLWVRASGFGSDGTPAGTRHMVNALTSLHTLGRPIVVDYLGGLVGASVIAFGASSGLAHGIAERERFSAADWDKLRIGDDDDEGRGGRTVRISIPGMGKSVTIPELEALSRARGGHQACVCQDRNCCPHGLPDMIKYHRRHNFLQSFNRIGSIEAVPDLNRTQHFLDRELALADRTARRIKELKPDEASLKPRAGESASAAQEKLIKRMADESHRIEKMRLVLENLHETRGRAAGRSLPVNPRRTIVEKRKRDSGS